MGLFDIDDEKLQAFYHRAWLESNRGFVDPRKGIGLDVRIMKGRKQAIVKYLMKNVAALHIAVNTKKM